MAARVDRLAWTDVALDPVRFPKAELALTLGLGSGLSRRASDGALFAVTDRGPNLFISQAVDDCGIDAVAHLRGDRSAKVMPLPTMGPEIVELEVEAGVVRVKRRTALQLASGARMSGAPPAGATEAIYDVRGRRLAPDPLGVDTEAIAALPDGGFFVAEEYGPSLLRVDADGVVRERWAPEGADDALAYPEVVLRKVLPRELARRRLNRGLEALCVSPDGRWLYLGCQSALEGQDPSATPVWKLDTESGAVVAAWTYPFDAPSSFKRDAARRAVAEDDLKICEFAWIGDDALVVLERIAHTTKLYRVALGRLPEKTLLFSSDDHPEVCSDLEGMALLSATEMLLVSDNDFGVEGAGTEFWRVTLDAA